MALSGFVCPLNGENTGFDVCVHKCRTRCIELPILMSFMEERVKVDGIFSVTELQKPPRIVAWERKNQYFLDPYAMVWSTFGTAYHAIVAEKRNALAECGNGERYTIEGDNHFCNPITIDGRQYYLRGTPDQYEWQSQTLTDYKTLKFFYDVKMMMESGEVKPEYLWQLNIYRWSLFPKCKTMQLEVIVKDWNRRIRDDYGVKPIVRINVPFISDEEVEAHVVDSIREIARAMDTTQVRDCTEEERWTNNMRCNEYCLVGMNGQCPQWETLKGESNGQAGSDSNRSRRKGSRKL